MNDRVTLVLPVTDAWRSVTELGLVTATALAAVESFSVKPVGPEPDFSEHDIVRQKAKAVSSMPGSLRSMIVPMNRATSFSWAPN